MKTQTLPQRAFNSPCIRFANFNNYSGHINLIRLRKPYANGISYAIHNTTETKIGKILFKNYDTALSTFNTLVVNNQKVATLDNSGVTSNAEY